MSLKDGTKKMSKSDPSEFSRINLNDDNDTIINKIKKAKTDTQPLPETIEELKKRPEADNLLGIYSSLNNQVLTETLNEFSGKNFSEFKKKLSDLLVEKIYPVSQKMKKIQKDTEFIDGVLKEGAEKADRIASKKVEEMKKIVGF